MHGSEITPRLAHWRLPEAIGAVGVGLLGAWLAAGAPTLASPQACAGLLEALLVAGARIGRNTALGVWLPALYAVATFAATALFAWIARRLTGHWSAYGAALALVLTPVFAPRLAPPESAIAVLTLAVAAALVAAGSSTLRRATWALIASTPLMAAAAPALTPGLMVASAWVVLRRSGDRGGRWAAAAVVLTAAAPVVVARALGALPPAVDAPPPCVLAPIVFDADVAWRALRDVLVTPAGPYALVLAALGAATWRRLSLDTAAGPLAVLALAPLVALGGGDEAVRVIVPTAVGLWLLVANGLAAVARACRPTWGGRSAAVLVSALLPAFFVAAPSQRRLAALQPMGHEALSAATLSQLVDSLPDGAMLVREDAATDILLRATDERWVRTRKSLSSIGRSSAALPRTIAERPGLVFALPGAQADLEREGFELGEAPLPRITGVAVLRPSGQCLPLTRDWQDVTAVAGPGLTVMTAGAGDEPGLELLASGSTLLAPHTPDHAELARVRWEGLDGAETSGPRRRDVLAERAAPADVRLLSPARLVRADITLAANARVLLAFNDRLDYAMARTAALSRAPVALCRAFRFERRPLTVE